MIDLGPMSYRDDPDPRLHLIWHEGVHAIEYQARSLDELRARAGAVLGVASIAAAFLAAAALDDGEPFRDATWVGTVAFAAVGLLTTIILVPVRRWRFHREPSKLLAGYVEHERPFDIDAMLHSLADHLQADFNHNAKKLSWRYWALVAACGALVVEILAFLWDLSSRR
jgi:hypothetical protein